MLTSQQLIQIRRQLHQIPELALEEYQTQQYLLQVIQNFKQQYLQIKTCPQLPTALLVRVQGSNPQKTIGYRADMDRSEERRVGKECRFRWWPYQ